MCHNETIRHTTHFVLHLRRLWNVYHPHLMFHYKISGGFFRNISRKPGIDQHCCFDVWWHTGFLTNCTTLEHWIQGNIQCTRVRWTLMRQPEIQHTSYYIYCVLRMFFALAQNVNTKFRAHITDTFDKNQVWPNLSFWRTTADQFPFNCTNCPIHAYSTCHNNATKHTTHFVFYLLRLWNVHHPHIKFQYKISGRFFRNISQKPGID